MLNPSVVRAALAGLWLAGWSLGCGGASTPATAGDCAFAECIADLEQPARTARAAARLIELAAEPGTERAIAPLLQAWERDQRRPVALRAAVTVAAKAPGGPYWKRVLPALRGAVSDAVASDSRSRESALIGIDALAGQRDPDGLPALVALARRSVPDLSPAHRLRMAAIAALGRYGDHRDAVSALIGLLVVEPSHRVQVVPAAAALALAESGSAQAIVPLLQAMVRIPRIHPQCRRALATLGKPVIPELIALLRGRQDRVATLARDLELNVGCEREMGLGTTCPQPAILRYRAAALLGDLRARSATTALLRALRKPPLPAFFGRNGPGADDHVAVLRALGTVGDAKLAPVLWAYAENPAHKPANRAAALAALAAVASDIPAQQQLARMIGDTVQPEAVRVAAAESYSRMVRDTDAMRPLVDALTGKTEPSMGDRVEPADRVRIKPFLRVARAHVGADCGRDPGCYIALAESDTDTLADALGGHIPTVDKWPPRHRETLAESMRERALRELGKLGAAARPVFDRVLQRVETPERAQRMAALHALARIAKLPCDACMTRLDAVIAADRADPSRTSLVVETRMTRDYFAWAGR